MTEEGGIELTPRELEICRMVAGLWSTQAIALKLGISTRTVQNHIYSAARQIPGRGQPMKRIIRYFMTDGADPPEL